jgi:hypothetical protein
MPICMHADVPARSHRSLARRSSRRAWARACWAALRSSAPITSWNTCSRSSLRIDVKTWSAHAPQRHTGAPRPSDAVAAALAWLWPPHGTASSRDTQHQQHAVVVVGGVVTSSLRNSSSTRRQVVGGAPLNHSLARSAASKRFDESFRCCRSASRSRCCGRCVRGHVGQPRGMSCHAPQHRLRHMLPANQQHPHPPPAKPIVPRAVACADHQAILPPRTTSRVRVCLRVPLRAALLGRRGW